MNVYLGELYKEVEYIQTNPTNPGNWDTAGQYIDTGIKVNSMTKVSIDMQFLSTAVQQRLFAVNEEPNGINFSLYINSSSYFASVTTTGNFSGNASSKKVDTNRYIHTLQVGTYTIFNSSGTQIYSGSTTGSVTGTSSQSMILLGNTRPGVGIKGLSYAKLYGCKIRDNGTLVRDFVPCYRVSDNVIGLFDKVENKFYTNAGTGSFTKGNDVKVFQPELKNAYIGEVYEYSYDFRGKSSTILTNDGWTIVSGSSYIASDSNGMYCSTNGRYFVMRKEFNSSSLSTATKISFTSYIYVNKSGGTGDSIQGKLTVSSDNESIFGSYTGASSATGPQGYQMFLFGGTTYINATMTQGLYQVNVTADLVNKTITGTYPGYYTNTKALTDANITTIRDMKYIYVIVYANANTPVYKIQGVDLLIE